MKSAVERLNSTNQLNEIVYCKGRVIIAGSTTTNEDSDSEETKSGVTVSGFNLREYRKKKPETYRQAGDDILEFMEEGLINPTVVLTVGLTNVNDALEFILKNKNPGKVIVNVKDR
ncbi:uncharacterized protein LOC113464039 [Ceratina calcarata]|uniref:Uncharacterized protein LOC113464039 n=1 Tax=Ceratina calcarata TaxID=156304 RepID=A0AAJ7RXF3_9HYME|nr:uncharacterized protein LOC113464039 [Ceratina calcarata]